MTLEQAFNESINLVSKGLFGKLKKAFASPASFDLRAISSSLLENEDVLFAASLALSESHGSFGRIFGFLIVTDHRVLYYSSSGPKDWVLDQIPIEAITSIDYSESEISAFLSIYGPSTVFHLDGKHILVQRARDIINQVIYSNSQKSTSTSPDFSSSADTSDVVQSLKAFKELLDSGIITQEEFDAKKKQLLGL